MVVTYVMPEPSNPGVNSRDLLILSWDRYVKRWTTVFDGAKFPTPNGERYVARSGGNVPQRSVYQ